MKRSLLRNATLLIRNPILSHSPNPAAASALRLRLFSSDSKSPPPQQTLTPLSETSSNSRTSTTFKRSLLRNATLFPCNLVLTHSPNPAAASALKLRFFSSDSESPPSQETPTPPSESSSTLSAIQKTDQLKDVSNKELKEMMGKYFKGDEEVLPLIAEEVFQRRLSGKHEDTDDELMEELEMSPLDEVRDDEFESDFKELHETDTEIDNLYKSNGIQAEFTT